MPDIIVTIGGREYSVSCQAGEEPFLRSAAALLDAEASVLGAQSVRIPEARMLLMAGLMLADKTAGTEDQLRALEARLAEREAEIEALRAQAAVPPEQVEVPVVAEGLAERLEDLARRAEYIAEGAEAALPT